MAQEQDTAFVYTSPIDEIDVDSETNDEEIARKIALKKIEFIKHAIVYIMIIGFLAVLNNLTNPNPQWWIWPAIGWGIGIISHFLSAFVFQSGKLLDKLTKQEMEKME